MLVFQVFVRQFGGFIFFSKARRDLGNSSPNLEERHFNFCLKSGVLKQAVI